MSHVAQTPADLSFTLTLNARIQPYVRHDFEDDLESQLSAKNLGVLDGGGTSINSEGEVTDCDINFVLNEPNAEKIAATIELISQLPWVPKGSSLVWEEDDARHRKAVGKLEGMALYINGTDLPDEVYENADVNDIVEDLNELMSPHGHMVSHWDGPVETALYFYGNSYEEMRDSTQKYRDETPLLDKSRVEQIA